MQILKTLFAKLYSTKIYGNRQFNINQFGQSSSTFLGGEKYHVCIRKLEYEFHSNKIKKSVSETTDTLFRLYLMN